MTRNTVLAAIAATLIAAFAPTALGQQNRQDLLDMAGGALILSATSQYSDGWQPLYLLDGGTENGWCCEDGKPKGNEFIIELARPFLLDRFVMDNRGNQEDGYPGISAKSFKLFGSNTSASGGFALILSGDAAQAARKEFKLGKAPAVRWLKLVIDGNYGNPEYTELMELEAYGEPSAETQKPVSVAGVYDTDYGLMGLAQSGQRIFGCYDYNDGRLLGSTDGRVLQMEWFEGENPDITHGAVLMVLDSSGEKLIGFYYRDGHLAGYWSGKRVHDGRKPECKYEDNSVGAVLAQTGRVVLYGLYFDTDSATIKPESEETLQELLKALQEQPSQKIEIGGHTDSTGADAHNQALSKSRAEAVKTWLTGHGIDAARMSCVGYGSAKPVADNNKPEGRALNRRVEVSIVK